MNISVVWHAPIPLRGYARELIDSFDFVTLPDEPGVYIFARRFGPKIIAIYVGKAEVLRGRIRQQLNNNRLMRALDEAPYGERVLICGTFGGKRGARIPTTRKGRKKQLGLFAETQHVGAEEELWLCVTLQFAGDGRNIL